MSVKRCARERWFFLNLLVTRALILLNIIYPYTEPLLTSSSCVLHLKSLFNKTLLFTAKVWCRQAGYRRLNIVEAVFYIGSRDPGRGIGWSKSQRRKSEVMCGRSRSGRPYLLRQAHAPRPPISPWLYIP